MQDLEIKGTGNSRFLKSSVPATTTWEDFLTMLRAGNLPIDLTGLNSAGIITQNPSAYNKANVLPDDVCSALGIDPQTSEPKDAFLGVCAALQPKVGDTLTTARTDLGEKWLVCNGAELDRDQYTELSQIWLKMYGLEWGTRTNWRVGSNSTYFGDIYDFIIVDDKPVFSASKGESLYPTIVYPNEDGGWNNIDLTTGVNDYGRLYGIAYGNGYYVASGSLRTNSGGQGGYIWYSTNYDSGWSSYVQLFYNSSSTYRENWFYGCQSVKFLNGYFVTVGTDGDAALWYTSDPSQTWTKVVIAEGTSNGLPKDFIYSEGKYIVYATGKRIYYSESLNGPWYLGTTISNIMTDSAYIGKIKFLNGQYVIYNPGASAFSTSTNLFASEWTEHTIQSPSSGNDLLVYSIDYIDGVFAISAYQSSSTNNYYIALSANLDGPYSYQTVYNTDAYCYSGLVELSDQLLLPARNYVYDAATDKMKIPEVSLADGLYTYIRAWS